MNRGRMRKAVARLAALILACALAAPWTGSVWAEKSVFFVAADQTVLPLSDDTMPFWQDGFLFISCAIFSDSVDGGAARRNLDISMTQNSDQDRVTLYRGTDFLVFEQGVPFATDQIGTIFYPGAVWRDGWVFVAADLVARYFGLLYSVTAVEHGSLVWLRNPSFRLEERAFADAAAWQLSNSYQEYMDGKASQDPAPRQEAESGFDATAVSDVSGRFEGAGQPDIEDRSEAAGRADAQYRSEAAGRTDAVDRSKSAEQTDMTDRSELPGQPVPAENPADAVRNGADREETPDELAPEENPSEEELPETAEAPEIQGGADLYLCFRAGEDTSAQLDTLDGADVRAAFFCDRDFLEREGDLVRRMAASGHSVGLLLSGAGGAAVEQAGGATNRQTEAPPVSPDPQERPPERTVSAANALAEAAEDCGRMLERAACLRTRLVFTENGTEADRAFLRSRGFVCPEPALDVSAAPPRTREERARFLREAEALGGRAAVWLGDGTAAEDLGNLLDAVQAAEDRCLPLTESSFS